MKLENYRKEDIYEVIERKNLMVHQLNQLDASFWTDDVRKAKQLIADLHAGFCELEKLQTRKALEDLTGVLNARGIKIRVLTDAEAKELGIRKTD